MSRRSREDRATPRPFAAPTPGVFALVTLLALAFLALCGALAPAAGASDVSADAISGLLRAGRYGDAEAQARILLHEIEEIHGAESLETADVLDLLSDALRLGGRAGDPEALAICQRALRIKAATVGKDDASYARSLHNLGALHLSRGRLEEARPLLREALGIRERALGANDIEVARSLLYLGHLEILANREDEARALVERAIAIQTEILPEEDPERARGLNMLGSILYRWGDYRGAAVVWERTLALNRRALGTEHPRVAESLHNLGAVHGEMGDAEEATRYLEGALRIRRKTLGKRHPLVASTLTSMASTLYESGNRHEARRRYEEALKIQKSAYPDGHESLAWTLHWLGRLASDEGRLPRARALLEEALVMQRRTLGEDHPQVAWTLQALAEVARRRGDLAEARDELERAILILTNAYDSGHPDLILARGRYARVLLESGRDSSALRVALVAARDRVAHLRLTARGLSERQALALSGVGAQGLHAALCVASRVPAAADSGTIAPAWDALIRSRTVVLDEMATRHQTAGRDESEAASALRVALEDARRRLANLLVRGIGADDPAEYRSIVARAQQEAERAERAVASRNERLRSELAESRIGFEEIREALPARTAIVAYVLYDSSDTRSYVAFAMQAGARPRAVPLGSERDIDALVTRWAGTVTDPGASSDARASEAEAECRAAGEALRRAIWDPVASLLHAPARVFFVMDGALHLVNIGALPSNDTYLVETGPAIHYLSSERDLAYRRSGAETGHGLLALGGPDYDRSTDLSGLPAERRSVDDSSGASGEPPPGERVVRGAREGSARGPLPDCAVFRQTKFAPLPESVREAREVADLWGDPRESVVLTGGDAGEGGFKRSAPGRRVLHLATHGFFLDARGCVGGSEGRRGIGGLSPAAGPNRTESKRDATADRAQGSPLLLSGLALAGANARYDTTAREEDGILTAEEVASLDLSGVQWVVLSACDTGLGRVQPGESVLGLRRSFEVAGAETLIMSLWSVDDRSARQWMHGLYEARFRRGRSTVDAVRDASLGVLRHQRAQGLSTHPFHWAAFVAVGDWN